LRDAVVSLLAEVASPEDVVEGVLAALPAGEHMPLSIIQVLGQGQAQVVECDAPPLFLIRHGQAVLLPVVEEVAGDHLIRRCRFTLQNGDHAVMVSEGYLLPWQPGWTWTDIAVAVRRWTDTGCDAKELLDALVRTYRRLKPASPHHDVTVVAMHARLVRSATVWTGPPVDPAQDEPAVERLMAERGKRIICGGTTAEIAARLLGAELEMESRPGHGWLEVPPVSTLDGVDLVTEGLVTLGKTRQRVADAATARDLPRSDDGATRLASALLAADRIRFIVGLAVNPQQVDESGVPLRRGLAAGLAGDLERRGKLVSVEYC
jgi:hypothetical protein